MAEVRPVSHDFKVFFRRLLVPAELQRNTGALLTASHMAGLVDPPFNAAISDVVKQQAKKVLTASAVNDLQSLSREQGKQFAAVSNEIFKSYQPQAFRADVIAKANSVAAEFRQSVIDKSNRLLAINAEIKSTEDKIASLSSGIAGGGALLSPSLADRVAADRSYYLNTAPAPVSYASAELVVPPSPIEKDRQSGQFQRTVSAMTETLATEGISASESNIAAEAKATAESLISQNPTPENESAMRLSLSSDLAELLRLMTPGGDNYAEIQDLKRSLGLIKQEQRTIAQELELLSATSQLRPFYEPVLLDALVGPISITTTMSRTGQPGTATIVFQLPLDYGGGVPALFMGIKSSDIFSLDLLEGQAGGKTSNVRGTAIPSQVLPILKENLRDTNINPFDMVQVWGHRRYNAGAAFPGDYYPVFTGFVTKVSVSYRDSSVIVTVNAEDAGKTMRLARVNIDPDLDGRFRVPGIDPIPLGIKLAGFNTGAEIIKGLVSGSPGTFIGMSNVGIVTKVSEPAAGSGTITQLTVSKTGSSAKVVSLAADFEHVKINLFEDLTGAGWPTYPKQWIQVSKLWETDAKAKWEIAREVAEITEYELYADNFGVINYHPPLYFLNPFGPQYLIENAEILDETHNVDEASLVTVMQVTSSPGFNLERQLNVAHALDSIVPAPDHILQRYGVRYAKKSAPIFSGTDIPVSVANGDPKTATQLRDAGRDAYARALMNRRNASLRTASVTINGCPEIRICNTVALVGDMKAALSSISTSAMFKAAAGAGGLPAVAGSLLSLRGVSAGAVEALKDVMVYYVSGITHNYTQGGSYTTTLTLTHGRRWTDPIPEGGVGFTVNEKENDAVVASMRAYFGQQNWPNSFEFASFVNNKLQYISGGNPAYLARTTDSQFGFSPAKPSASTASLPRVPTAAEVQGYIQRSIAAACRRLTTAQDPRDVKSRVRNQKEASRGLLSGIGAKLKKVYNDALKAIKDLFSGKTLSSAKLQAKFAAYLENLVKKQQQALANYINAEEQKLLDSVFGKDGFKVFVAKSFTTPADLIGTDVAALVKIPGLPIPPVSLTADEVAKIANFNGGIAFYVYGAKGTDTVKAINNTAAQNLKSRAVKDLNASNPSQLSVAIDRLISTTYVVIPKATVPGQTPPAPVPTIYGFGIYAVALRPSC